MSLGKPFLFLTLVPQEKILLARRALERLTNVKKKAVKKYLEFLPTRLCLNLSTTHGIMECFVADHVLSLSTLQTGDKN